jgi:DNA repair exonuclease SbcCD ATPase subunit
MERPKIDAWARFFDDVVSRSADWPRELWLVAVEDALSAALPAHSGLLEAFRRDHDEVRQLELAANGSVEDARRLEQLESQIERLIGLADGIIRRSEPVEAESSVRHDHHGSWGRAVAGLVAMLLVIGGGIGVGYRMQAGFEEQLAQMQERHDRQLAMLRSELGSRVAATERMQDRFGELHAELRSNVDDFSALMTESVTSMLTLGNSAIDELERRLTGQGSEIGKILDRSRERATSFDEGLDRLGDQLVALGRRVAALRPDLDRLEGELSEARADLGQAVAEVGAVADLAPELAAWTERERAGLETEVGDQRAALALLATEISTFEDGMTRSRALMGGFDQEVAESLARAKQDSAALEAAAEDARAIERSIDGLQDAAAARLANREQEVQQEMDQLLTALADKADLAVQHSEDVMQRATTEAQRRIEAEAETSAAALAEQRAAWLTELTELAAAARTEVEQTRSSLVLSWQRMDQTVGERQARVLADLDRHAGDLEDRVRAFVEALDVMVAQTGSSEG